MLDYYLFPEAPGQVHGPWRGFLWHPGSGFAFWDHFVAIGHLRETAAPMIAIASRNMPRLLDFLVLRRVRGTKAVQHSHCSGGQVVETEEHSTKK